MFMGRLEHWCLPSTALERFDARVYHGPEQSRMPSALSSLRSRTATLTVGFCDPSTPFGVGLSPAAMITFPAPATSNPACLFPPPGFLGCFASRVMPAIGLEGLSRRPSVPRSGLGLGPDY